MPIQKMLFYSEKRLIFAPMRGQVMENKLKNQKIIYFQQTDSTNDRAWDFYAKNPINSSDLYVFQADFQSKGRGCAGNVWESVQGENLLFSLLFLKDSFVQLTIFHINQILTFSLCELLQKMNLFNPKIKWPNDLYIDAQKIAGVLIETKIQNQHIKAIVCGIGLNLNQAHFEQKKATSLFLQMGKKYDKLEILNYFLEIFRKNMSMEIEKIKKNFLENLLFFGVFQNYHLVAENREKTLKIIAIAEDGALVLIDQNEEKFTYYHKEIFPIF